MNQFTMEIARTVFDIQCFYDSTAVYFRNYLSRKEPEASIELTEEDLSAEQHLLDIEADETGLKRRVFSAPFLERTAIARKVAASLLPRNILLLHGSTVAVDGKAYLFTAKCGVGKSTHTRFWREQFGNRAVMINDDRAFLEFTSAGILAYGSPWSGKHGLDSNLCVPLCVICFLERGTENSILPFEDKKLLFQWLSEQIFIPDESLRTEVNTLAAKLPAHVRFWRMQCTNHPSAAIVSYEAMSGSETRQQQKEEP